MYDIGLKLWSINTEHYLREAQRLYTKGIYNYIELYVVPDTMDTLNSWKTLNIPFIIHNAHFAHRFNLAKKSHRKRNKEIYDQSKIFADTLRSDSIIVHGGIDGEAEETVSQLLSLNDGRAILENKPFVALPNRMGGKFCRGATEEELSFILKEVNCRFCLDIGHAICSANSQNIDPYAFLQRLMKFSPFMFHLSDVSDLSSPYDTHPHLGTGMLDFRRLVEHIFPRDAIISVETDKNHRDSLDDFVMDVEWLKHLY